MSNTLSIIIPTYHETDEDILSIISDINQKFPEVEIIISDGSYNSTTKKKLDGEKNVRYIENLHHIRSTGLNIGAGIAT